jgi:predicted nucleic acid-binding Zn ribbon protein
MSFTSISTITSDIQDRPGWEGVRDWGLIVRAWLTTVSPTIATRSRPKSLANGVLTIATSSSSLAHQLTFGRQALCKQLNTLLVVPINDLRFIPVGFDRQERASATDDRAMAIDAGEIVICPRCDCRARAGELLRWGVCQFCAIDLGIVGGKLSPKL